MSAIIARAGRWLRAVDGWVPLVMAALIAALYSATSVRRHINLQTSGFDLGIFVQEVRSYATLQFPPTATLKGPGFNLFGDHVSPIVALLAPFYRIFPSAVTLLIAQAILLSLPVIPLMRFARRRLGTGAMLVIGPAYGLSWGVANAANFDFHEVAFAVLPMTMAGIAFVERRYLAAVWWSVPLVLTKEDLGLNVAVLGLLIAWRGRRRLGLLTAAGGFAASALDQFVLIPAANPHGRNDHDGYFAGSAVHDVLTLLAPDTKIITLVWLLAPTAFLAVRSSVLWLALPTILWRFASSNASFWGTWFHYSAVLMPIVFVAFVDALTHYHGRRLWPLAVSAAVTVYLIPQQTLDQALSAPLWTTSANTAAVHQLLAEVPSGHTVAASNNLAAQLTSRDDVSLIGRIALGPAGPEYAVIDLAHQNFPLGSAADAQTIADQAEAAGYRQIGAGGGVVLLTRLPAVALH